MRLSIENRLKVKDHWNCHYTRILLFF